MFAKLRRLRFTTRDALWLTVVVALVCSRFQPPQRKPVTTGRELDVRIHGEGYLVVRHFPSGRFGYTRDGRLSFNACAQICAGRPTMHDCWVIEPSLTFPQPVGTVTIERDGLVYYSQPGDELKTQSGQMQLASFVNPAALNEVADGIFEPTMDSGVPLVTEPGRSGMGYIEQGALEFAPRSVAFNPVYFTCIVCCGAALVCMRKAYPARHAHYFRKLIGPISRAAKEKQAARRETVAPLSGDFAGTSPETTPPAIDETARRVVA